MRLRTFAVLATASALFSLGSAGADTIGADSNLPVPRFVSLKNERVNGRHGPGTDHGVDWVYERAGLPLMVTGESGPWRRVRDPDGGVVWMHWGNLDPRRTVYVTRPTVLRDSPSSDADVAASLERGVIGTLTACQGDWRRVAIGTRVGWVDNSALWAGDCDGLRG